MNTTVSSNVKYSCEDNIKSVFDDTFTREKRKQHIIETIFGAFSKRRWTFKSALYNLLQN